MPKINDLTEHRFGKLVVKYPTCERNHKGEIIWECQCDCGGWKRASTTHLKAGYTRSCGCLSKEASKMQMNNIAGQKFDQLTAVQPTDLRSGTSVVWKCRCDCGKVVFASVQSLK